MYRNNALYVGYANFCVYVAGNANYLATSQRKNKSFLVFKENKPEDKKSLSSGKYLIVLHIRILNSFVLLIHICIQYKIKGGRNIGKNANYI